MLTLMLVLASAADFEVCREAVASHCMELACEQGGDRTAGHPFCTESVRGREVYERCFRENERECRVRFPVEG